MRNRKHLEAFDATDKLSWLRDYQNLASFDSIDPCITGVQGKFVNKVSLVGPRMPVFEKTTEA
jgi:hypothetical protein